jgi:signal transduction histidine kinase/putative methionine-R-sulfoxide reductase with GAF domain
MDPQPPPPDRPDAVVTVEELAERPSRTPELAAENRALVALAEAMAGPLEDVLPKLTSVAVELCRADSAGVSVLEEEDGCWVFRWHAIVGPFARHLGGVMPRHVSPCGLVFDRNEPLLFQDPARQFGFDPFDPPVVEALIVPVREGETPVGTLWVLHHTEEKRFDAEDARLLVSLSRFATAAYTLARGWRADAALRASEGRHRFLANLAAATQMLVNPGEIMATTARMLAEHLGVDRCAYAEIEDERVFVITGDFTRDVPSIVGRWPVAAFGAEVVRHMLDNEPYVVEDVDTDPRCGQDLSAYRATMIQAVICVPLHKAGKFTAAMAVHQKTPRRWTPDEVGLVLQVVGRCWEALERARAEERLSRLLERERERGRLLQQVADAALTIHASGSLESALQVIAEEARRIIGAHQARTSLTIVGEWSQAINTVSMSDKYAPWRSYDAPTTGKGIYAEVCRTNRPMRLTHAELVAHPAWRNFSGEEGRHPPMRGWLAAPFVSRSGKNLGLIQLTDKYEGDFAESDEAILVQLTHIASVAIENARLYDALREQDRRKDEFLATLAHELRNPLAPIRTGLEILKVAGDGERGKKLRDMMERQVGHMVRMVDDLLDVSRITRGKVELRKERVELGAVVESAVETSQPLIQAARHSLDVELPAKPLLLDADPTRLAQVFANLLNNAAKYTPAGGRIRIAAALDGAGVVVRVEDTGVGIPADMLPKVFDMFIQVGRSIDRAQGGLGIGLTLVRELVLLHGGTIDAASDGPGRGSTFTVRLPLAGK